MKHTLTILVLVASSLAAAAPAAAKTYAIVVGYNGVPETSVESLRPLRYADDDAARWAAFLGRFADVSVLTVLDEETQRVHPGLAAKTRVPTAANLERAVARVRAAVEEDAARGEESVVFFVYSGHGAHTESGAPFLTLHGADQLGRAELYASVGAIGSRFTHVVIDACHAAAIVGARGDFFGEEREAEHPQDGELLEQLAVPPDMSRHPQIGALLSASAGESSHEWSEISAGVFTHEVLSALHGAADINADGRIEYSEVAAYVAAANSEVDDPRAVPTVVVRPPAADTRVALVDVRAIGRVMHGSADELGRFDIETSRGVRIAQGNLAGAHQVALLLPEDEAVHLHIGDQEAVVPAGKGDVAVATLALGERTEAARGAVDAAFRRGLFAAPYGPSYYRGFVDSNGFLPASPAPEAPQAAAPALVAPAKSTAVTPRRSPAPAIVLFAAGGALLAGGIGSSLAAADAARDFRETPYQRQAADALRRYEGRRNRSYVLYALSAAATSAGFLVFPWRRANAAASVSVAPGGASVGISGNW